jgi:hypothetical protein
MDGEEKALINLFVRRNGTWKGEEVARLCSVSFPVMDEEYTGGKAIYGKNLARVSDKEAFFKLIRHILPGIDEADLHYNYGSNSPVAPNFHALMMAYSRVAKDINAQLKIFESYNPALKAWIIPTNWTKEMSMLNDYRLDIPSSLPGNEGEADEGTLKEEKDRLAKEKGREERRELRDQHSRGGNRYTDNRGSRDEPRRASWGGGRRDERDDDRGGRGGNWGGRGRDDDRDDRDSRYSRDRGRSRDDYDDRRGRERDRDDRYSRDREDDRGRGRDDARETTSSGISRDWGESVRDDRSRDRGRGGWRR